MPRPSDEQLALASLCAALPRRRVRALLAETGGAIAAWASIEPVIKPVNGSPDAIGAQCERFGLELMSLFDTDYPEHLGQIPDPPLVLYLRGKRERIATPGIAIVGARRCSRVGAEIAAGLAADLACLGMMVVSGLALGIDGAAHRGALAASTAESGLALAVLGSGLARVYPRTNARLAEQLLAEGGLLVSEYAPELPPARHQFPERNRLISGLSLGVIIVEAGDKSGSLITARLALEQGREVLAVPGSLSGGRSRGCHRMLKQGAALVEDVADVCEALGINLDIKQPRPRPVAMGAELAPVLAALGPTVLGVDEIAHAAGIAVQVATSRLLLLELEGFVAQVPGGYIRRPFSG